ncbi:hypothetical protein [Nocardia sp. NBC_00416]|uniref:hypothetical protein n=1 Tax=Nocardia sp. NBC_00416 TaxID=2975991 RepID=UPI002E22BD64
MRVERLETTLWRIAPPGAPATTDADPGLDTAVLEVAGGHLSWSLLADQRVPAATLHDLDTAQEWLWALYGADVAVAADDYTGPVELPARPERPELAAAVRRLGYAHWAARWWPASIVDGIPALDARVLDGEIVELSEFCESVVDGADVRAPVDSADTTARAGSPGGVDRSGPGYVPDETRADYALAAGAESRDAPGALTLGRGSAGWDWRHCPPGVVDASEHAVSWELVRIGSGNVVRVRAVAAPGAGADLPGHLRPHALVRTPAGSVDTALVLRGDTWTATVADTADSVSGVEVFVPGVGPAAPGDTLPRPYPTGGPPDTDAGGPGPTGSGDVTAANARQRGRIRELAQARLRRAGLPGSGVTSRAAESPRAATGAAPELVDIAPLYAETAAAEADSDF